MLATPTNETDVGAGGRAQALAAPLDAYTRGCAALARACMWTSVFGLICLIVAVTLQIVGRHVLNSTPTWAESLALLLVLYVTMLGAAVGVRDAGHIGFESLLDALPPAGQRRLRVFIHLLVLLFGVLMAWNCGVLAESVAAYKIPNLGISNAWKYIPATLSGTLIALFSIEHIIAILRNHKVVPAWR
ncbi:TRAP transporter small permease [Achromobacter marplatensis]|uniref:TRAP transporter small permease n=1 Tax=Achromobacter marplatensis TaxID=470868 RepID=UPI000277FE67|nr:TRAP transporter small permease [Achromobacter marplatensis]EJO29530.1 tripartite ATP-independent periplasmic transporter DctQ [Achromobacter marplatensis]